MDQRFLEHREYEFASFPVSAFLLTPGHFFLSRILRYSRSHAPAHCIECFRK